MQQVIVDIYGFAVPGFGAMLFITFVACIVWGVYRCKKVGLPGERAQDMIILIFISGIAGARLLYMWQYSSQFPDKSLFGLVLSFFQIWKGGIIFYGSALGGTAGYGLFYWFVLRKMHVSGWKLADAVAPVMAFGLAIGRIGCYLNGCCYGQVAIEETCPVPLGGAHFPLLPAPARDLLVRDQHLQTSTGFTIGSRDRGLLGSDPRSVVRMVEPDSPATAAGLKVGDRIVGVDGKPNAIIIDVFGNKAPEAIEELHRRGGELLEGSGERPSRVRFDDFDRYVEAVLDVRKNIPSAVLAPTDSLAELIHDWPRGRKMLDLKVRRDDREIALPPFTPVTVGLYPTQLYETVSMLLLVLMLLAYYPLRHHDGELMVLCMMGYAIHRFVNESLRIEPEIGLGLTLSQWGSVAIFTAALGIEIYLWIVMPSRWSKSVQAVS